MSEQTFKFQPSRRYLFLLAVLGLALYVIVPQFGDFSSSWHLLSRPSFAWAGAAVALAGLTYFAGAATYCLLAFKPLRYRRTVVMQMAAMFINRLLPGGIGALGANFLYLRRNRHTAAQAGTTVAVNNLLGFTGHWLLVGLALLVFSENLTVSSPDFSLPETPELKAAAVIAALVFAAVFIFARRRLKRSAKDVKKQVLSYRRRPARLGGALLTSMALTSANVLCLYACAASLGVSLPLAAVLIIFTFGISLGTALPTPGGLGGFEAGLVAGFVAYGVDSSSALAAALLYRFITYWLALAAGAVAFIVSQRRGYI